MQVLYPGRIGIWRCWFLWREENRRTRRKILRGRHEPTTNTTHIYMALCRNQTRVTLVEGERSNALFTLLNDWLRKNTHLHVYISVNKSHRSLPRYDVSQYFGEVVVVPVAIWRIVWRWYTAWHVYKLASYRYHIWILFHGVSHPDEVPGVKFIEYPTKTKQNKTKQEKRDTRHQY